MSTRRIPLSSNPNAANSPLRPSASLLGFQSTKVKARSHAEIMREEPYGQPPPAKRQMIDHGVQRAAGSPARQRPTRTVVHRHTARTRDTTTERASHAIAYKPSQEEIDNIRQWQTAIRARFPKMVFYFESIPDDQRSKLAKQVTHLGAREERFFSIDITHVVTTRQIPTEKLVQDENEPNPEGHTEQPKTIDPSLLNRKSDVDSVRRKLVFDTASRRAPAQPQDDALKRPKTRNNDVLHRALDMGKKIWTLEKLQKILDMALEPDPYRSAVLGQGRRAQSGKTAEQSNLLQMLQNERVHGPSDRDPTVITREMHFFKGPYIYVYDIEEKMKPIMVREYAKVADKKDGEWPQFRVASQGRCPFVEDYEPEREHRAPTRAKERAAKVGMVPVAPTLKPPEVPPPKPVTGKRTLVEMEDGQNRGVPARHAEPFDRSKVAMPPSLDFRAPTQGAFTSHAKMGRLLGGEPVASGLQRSNITSAIRSQVVSSTSGLVGAKAGTSKEIHGLKRKVLQKASTPAVSQDLSSRQMTEEREFIRSASLGLLGRQATEKDGVSEKEEARQKEKLRRTVSVPIPKKRDPKPGYCENCQDKFDDFDDHIHSRKHRRFAENDKNWAQLDALLTQLKRVPRFGPREDEW